MGRLASAQAIVSTIVDTSAYRFTDDLIFDDSGNLYCADYSGDAIYKRTPDGDVFVFAEGFDTPNGLAFDSSGNLFVCDNLGDAIYKLSSSGVVLDTISVSYPSGIIKDALSDTLIFTTYGTLSKLMKLAPDGTVHDFHSGLPLFGPVGLAYCQGELYTSNFNNREIYRVESDSLVYITQLPGSGSLGFIAEVGDQLMATAFTGHKIYWIDPITHVASLYSGSTQGDTDGAIEVAKFNTPNGIVANAAGDTIYISEYNSKKLRMIAMSSVSVENSIETIDFDLFPNPTADFINIAIHASILPYSLRIVNLQGKEVLNEKTLYDTNLELNLSELETGTYVIELESLATRIVVKKMIQIHK